jgi:Transposase DDE domain group 1
MVIIGHPTLTSEVKTLRRPITIKHEMEKLASHSGLINIGALLDAINFKARFETISGVHCVDPKISHADILASMIALMSIGKPDYDAIEIFRKKQEFFNKAVGIGACPSSPSLRQRIDLIGNRADMAIKDAGADLVRSCAPAISPIHTSAGDFLPLDMDVSPFDNSKTQKEGVSRTYKGVDGFAPIFAYLGAEGYLVNLELREGKQHCQKNTPEFISSTLDYVRKITDRPVLMRLDSGNDSRDNFPDASQSHVHFIIKRNLRRESPQAWVDLAKKTGVQQHSRPGKRVWIGKTLVDINGNPLPHPIIFEVTERQSKKGQALLFPEYQIDTYWCSLDQLPPQEVIELYHNHGTSEQFHSELKSDMGLERLPSGHFSSNSLILHLAMLTYNMLRIIGQISLEESDPNELPGIRNKKVSRRRIRTVMQDLMYMAGRLVTRGRQWYLSFGQLNPFSKMMERIYHRLSLLPAAR